MFGLLDIKPDIQALFRAQRDRFISLRGAPIKRRIQSLKKLEQAILEMSEDISEALALDFCKPVVEVLTTEIFPVIQEIRHAIRRLPGWAKPKRVNPGLTFIGSRSSVRIEPKGVVLIISPWNYPFQLAVGPLVSAIAAGNNCIVKPSEISTNTAGCIEKLIRKVFPPEEAAVIQGGSETAEALLELPFDHVFFTGGTAIGRRVMAACAEHLTSVTLELGGKSPVIIDPSADLVKAAESIAWGKLLNAGQTCVAPDYLLIPEEMERTFISLFKAAVDKGYGTSWAHTRPKDYSRIVNLKHFRRVSALIDGAVRDGAKQELNGIPDENDLYLPPTLLTGVSEASAIMNEEIFGPVLPILTYSSLGEVIDYINSKPNPLALYIFSRNPKNDELILANTTSGDAEINGVILHAAATSLPFGGAGSSGIGKSHGYAGFMEFSRQRSVMKQSGISAARLFYPPYTEKIKRLAHWTARHL